MTPRYLLVAASGLAAEAVEAIRAAGAAVAGVLDDDPARHGTHVVGAPVLGGTELVHSHPTDRVLLCAGRGRTRRAIAERLGLPDERYGTIAHPSVRIPASCRVGAGSIVLAGCVLTAAVTVGRHVVLMPHVILTHDDVLDDYATACSGAALGGGVTVGEGAYLGMQVAVREHVEIGPGATVGMGAAVLSDVPAGQRWAGVPARPIPPRRLGVPA